MTDAGISFHAFVDWDDTIKVTNAYYHAASARNAELLLTHLRACRLGLSEIEARVHAIDLAKSHQHGLRRHNFAEAWVEVYEGLAQELGTLPIKSLADAIYANAVGVPDMPQEDYPGARELLIELRRLGFEITIWTAGEKAVQESKIIRSGYRSLVDRVCVVSEKTPQTLKAALGARDPKATFVIGNSPRSDIAPALALGICAIHVLQDTWAYDDAQLDTHDPNYYQAASLTDALNALQEAFPSVFAAPGRALA